MATTRHIRKVSSGTLACNVNWKDQHGQALPKDLIEEAAGRLRGICLIYAATYFVAFFVSGLTDRMRGDWVHSFFFEISSLVAWGSILFSLAMYFWFRFSKMASEKMLDLGLGVLVIGAMGISSTNFWGIYSNGLPEGFLLNGYAGVPWEGIWILMFPVMVPNCPKKTLMAALVAASTGPVITSLSLIAGATSPDISHWFFWRYFLFTSYICALLSWFISSYIHKLGRNLTRAREVGSYKMVTKLGEGGMGEVWLADHRFLARPAAIKLIKPELLGQDARSRQEAMVRFKREAQATASLHSPHTIELFDFGDTANGSFYYVMELLKGISLDQFINRFGPQSPERVVFILKQICHSLQDAHDGGVIHRDIKPSNLLLCQCGRDCDFMKVLDFGLVNGLPPVH